MAFAKVDIKDTKVGASILYSIARAHGYAWAVSQAQLEDIAAHVIHAVDEARAKRAETAAAVASALDKDRAAGASSGSPLLTTPLAGGEPNG